MPQWKEKNEKSASSNPETFSELLILLECNDSGSTDSVKEAIQDALSNSKDSKLLSNLIEFYVATQSENAFDVLLHVKEPHDKHIYEKMNDMIKNETTRYSALQLLGRIVFKQPTWLHKISGQRLMHTLLHMLKTDSNSPNLLSGLFIIISILPLIPHQFGSLLSDTFDVFSRLTAWNVKKPSTLSEILNLHLQTGVYALFHRLYGMYPCNFLAYLRSFYGGRDCSNENFEVFIQVIKPMLERVRLHPLLVTASKETELSVNRWRKMEYHDIVVECASISLDSIEGTHDNFRNASLSVSSQTENISCSEGANSMNYSSLSSSSVIIEANSSLNDNITSDQQIWSPSQICETPSLPYSSNDLTLPPVAKGEWELKNVMQSSMEESIPLDFAVEAKPEPLKSDLDSPKKLYINDFSNEEKDSNVNMVKLQKSEMFSQNSTDSDIMIIYPEKCITTAEAKEDDVDKEVSDITTQVLEHSMDSDDLREDTPFCSTTQNLTDEPANLTNTVMSLSGRSESLTKSTEDDTDEMYNSMQESDLCVPTFSRYRFYSHCGPAPDIVTVVKKPKAFHSLSCPANFFDPQSSSTELNACNGETVEKTDATIVTCRSNVTTTTTSAFASLPSETTQSKNNNKILPVYQLLLPAVVNPSLFLDQPVTIGQKNMSQNKMPKYFSPPQLLDVYIQEGNASYLNYLPLTSRKETDWTHFGGKPPPDEIEVLKNQTLLLHNMLLFERHRKEIHSERNRRILGRIKRARMHEEFIEALKSEILILTNENNSLRRELLNQNKIYNQHMNQKKKNENELDSKILKLGQENTQLLFSNKQLQTLLVSQKGDNDEIREFYKKVQADVENMKCQLRFAKIELQLFQKIKKEATFLTKQLILLQELNAHYKSKLEQNKQPEQPNITSSLMDNSMRVEIAGLKQKLDAKSVLLDSCRGRVNDLENTLSNLKLQQRERTNSCEAMKSFHQAEVTAQKERLQDLQKISAEKDAHILKLYADVDELKENIESIKRKYCSTSKHKSSNSTAAEKCSTSQRTDDALS